MIYQSRPEQFSPAFEVVSCFCEFEETILLLHRIDSKSHGNKWGLPAGKIEYNENEVAAILREVKEETGIIIEQHNLYYFGKIYVKHENYEFIYHMFHVNLLYKPDIQVNPREHKGCAWFTIAQALKLNLVEDLDKCIEMFYQNRSCG